MDASFQLQRVRRKVARLLDPPQPVAEPVDHASPIPPGPRPADRYLEFPQLAEHDKLTLPWPVQPQPGYVGQLDAQYQAVQRALRADFGPEHGHWYHETALPDGQHIRGAWNLVGQERQYIGSLDVAGRRIIEFGPATGHLSVWLTYQGADVVAFDAGLDRCIDLLTYEAADLEPLCQQAMALIGRVQNSWWWLTSQWGVTVPAVYGEIYDLPKDLGVFDVSFFGAILLHLRDPYQALYQASRITTSQIVVTDVIPPGHTDLDEDYSEFNPAFGDGSSWCRLSAKRIVRMLSTMGFADCTVQRHYQFIRPNHDIDKDFNPVEYFTVVANRTAPLPA